MLDSKICEYIKMCMINLESLLYDISDIIMQRIDLMVSTAMF